MRRFVPLSATLWATLLGALCLPGCYEAHGLAADAPVIGRDAGPGPIDVPIRPDIGDPPRCPVQDVNAACLNTGNAAIPPGRPFDLPVYLAAYDGCFCGETIECDVGVSGNVIELRTSMCSEILCDGCMPSVEGACALPALERGTYRVRMNGRDAFDVEVSDVSPFVPVNTCFATPGPEGCAPIFSPQPVDPIRVCVSDRGGVGEPIAVEITNGCGGCGATPGPCQVLVNGNEISINPQELPSSCFIDCDGCSTVVSTCFIPPLPDGSYTVRVDPFGGGGGLPLEIRDGRSTAVECVGRRD